jgi:hypothetical protein
MKINYNNISKEAYQRMLFSSCGLTQPLSYDGSDWLGHFGKYRRNRADALFVRGGFSASSVLGLFVPNGPRFHRFPRVNTVNKGVA